MIATIAEPIRVYGKLDRRHETIAPFLAIRMRTGLIMDLEPVRNRTELGCLNRPSLRGVINRDPKSGLTRCHLEYDPPYGKSPFGGTATGETSYLELSPREASLKFECT
jgi:hypothetical protein